MVKDIRPGSLGSSYSYGSSPGFGVLGNSIFFGADDGTNGRELWKSDGTPGGTQLVKDIRSGADDSISLYSYGGSAGPTAIDGTLYFAASGSDSTGTELWGSDGTAAGTTLVKDLLPGPEGSYPSGFTLSGDNLFFSASDGVHGTELWAADLAGDPVVPPVDPPVDPPVNPNPVDNQFKLPKKGKVNLKKGTVTVKIKLPGPGKLAAKQAPAKKKKSATLVKPRKVKAKKAGFVKVLLKPAKAGLKKLKKRGKKPKVRKFKALMRFTYTPTGGESKTKQRKYTFKKR